MIRNKKGFTLVELLAVIVILAIILVIAVPQIIKTIDSAREGAFSSSAKLIATTAEKEYLARKTIGDTSFEGLDTIPCTDVVKENTNDYQSCDISFDENGKATVTLIGKGKFAGKYICNGNKTSAEVTETACTGDNGGTGSSESSGVTYIENLLATAASANGLENPKVTNGEDEYDTGIRYVGVDPNNYVWFNCNSTDKDGREYGNADYVYDETVCEKWRIIGVFDVEGTERIKIINTSSRFSASWDSSASTVNKGFGINQWGSSVYLDSEGNATTTEYEGADLMRLLNGYYIETNDDDIADKDKSACTYCTNNGQASCSTTTNCSKLKPLTESALGMISNAKWYTYAVEEPGSGNADVNYASTAYLQERGIIPTPALTGKDCTADENYCSDSVARENEWTGKVGLMYASDIMYANGWLNGTNYPWSISPRSRSSYAGIVWGAGSSGADTYAAGGALSTWPAVYLNSNVEITGAEENVGTSTNPYVLRA